MWPQVRSHGVAVVFGGRRVDAMSDKYTYIEWNRVEDVSHPERAVRRETVPLLPGGTTTTLWPASPSLERVRALCGTMCYGDVPGLRIVAGPRRIPTITDDDTATVPLAKGSAFHLRYVLDPGLVASTKTFGSGACAPAAWAWTHHARLLTGPRVATPLYLDRDHPQRDQLRACRLPPGWMIDGGACVHLWVGDPSLTDDCVADFLLGFWNSRFVYEMLCNGILCASSTWITQWALRAVPFPHLDLVDALGQPQHPASRLARAARVAERARSEALALLARDQLVARDALQWLREGGPSPSFPTCAKRRECLQRLGETFRDADRQVEDACAELYRP